MKKWQLYLLLLFVSMLIAGILLGDAEKTFGKAINICLECVGIG